MKNRIDSCDGTKISVVLPLGIIRIDERTVRYGPFFGENQFSPADEFVLVGLVVRKCHFDVTACAEARRLDKILIMFKRLFPLEVSTAYSCRPHTSVF